MKRFKILSLLLYKNIHRIYSKIKDINFKNSKIKIKYKNDYEFKQLNNKLIISQDFLIENLNYIENKIIFKNNNNMFHNDHFGGIIPKIFEYSILNNNNWHNVHLINNDPLFCQGRLKLLYDLENFIKLSSGFDNSSIFIPDFDSLFFLILSKLIKNNNNKNTIIVLSTLEKSIKNIIFNISLSLNLKYTEIYINELDDLKLDLNKIIAIIFQIPDDFGYIFNPINIFESWNDYDICKIVISNVLCNLIIIPPNEMNFDISIGSLISIGQTFSFGGGNSIYAAYSNKYDKLFDFKIIKKLNKQTIVNFKEIITSEINNIEYIKDNILSEEFYFISNVDSSFKYFNPGIQSYISSLYIKYYGYTELTELAKKINKLSILTANYMSNYQKIIPINYPFSFENSYNNLSNNIIIEIKDCKKSTSKKLKKIYFDKVNFFDTFCFLLKKENQSITDNLDSIDICKLNEFSYKISINSQINSKDVKKLLSGVSLVSNTILNFYKNYKYGVCEHLERKKLILGPGIGNDDLFLKYLRNIELSDISFNTTNNNINTCNLYIITSEIWMFLNKMRYYIHPNYVFKQFGGNSCKFQININDLLKQFNKKNYDFIQDNKDITILKTITFINEKLIKENKKGIILVIIKTNLDLNEFKFNLKNSELIILNENLLENFLNNILNEFEFNSKNICISLLLNPILIKNSYLSNLNKLINLVKNSQGFLLYDFTDYNCFTSIIYNKYSIDFILIDIHKNYNLNIGHNSKYIVLSNEFVVENDLSNLVIKLGIDLILIVNQISKIYINESIRRNIIIKYQNLENILLKYKNILLFVNFEKDVNKYFTGRLIIENHNINHKSNMFIYLSNQKLFINDNQFYDNKKIYLRINPFVSNEYIETLFENISFYFKSYIN